MTDPARCNPLWEALGAGEEKQLCGTCLRLRAVVGLTRTAMYDSWHLADRASERYQPTEPGANPARAEPGPHHRFALLQLGILSQGAALSQSAYSK